MVSDAITEEQYARFHEMVSGWNMKPGAEEMQFGRPSREQTDADLRSTVDARAGNHGPQATLIGLVDALSLCAETFEQRRKDTEKMRGERFNGYFLRVLDAKIVDALQTAAKATAPPATSIPVTTSSAGYRKSTAPSPSKSSISDETWRHYVQFWLDGKGWPTASSRAPDCPHCKVPAGVLAEFRAQIDAKIAGGQR